MAKKNSAVRVKAREKPKRKPARGTKGLAAVLGGWPGSDDLAKILDEIVRTRHAGK
jgi:hypothetical protein